MIDTKTELTTKTSDAPIGIFDSGVGGLSVFRHLQQLMPNERYVYYADTQNIPYGSKSGDEILFLTLQAVDWLCQQGCKLIVIACNSASAHALTAVRSHCSVPIVGLVPAVKPACQISQNKQIAVLATQATLQGRLLAQVIDEVATPNAIIVHKHFEPMLVPWVELGMPIDHQVADLLIEQMQVWHSQGVDVVVLGCTHYPFFRQFLQEWIDSHAVNMTLLDSGAAIAERVKSLLDFFGIKSSHHQPADVVLTFYASSMAGDVANTAQRLAGVPMLFVDSEFSPLYP
ncbi:glutamate racemase [Moraxella cuniculi DSM 21768]|uniref:Glutamate racemase n=1 Tax=Moraxella cuniculi DSM 21768 TaxID=1122245 RepID=A0A1N7EBT1_9GAMM|nr:glutamate racemase [Moraxella cuniculi]OOS05374.1 glutamate racemase [Moraxella cuniculi]SIR85500.1 glutamate racemase [Moraxella cuniculi DSM 21768]